MRDSGKDRGARRHRGVKVNDLIAIIRKGRDAADLDLTLVSSPPGNQSLEAVAARQLQRLPGAVATDAAALQREASASSPRRSPGGLHVRRLI